MDAAIAVAELMVMWPSDPVGEALRELAREPGRLLPRLPMRRAFPILLCSLTLANCPCNHFSNPT
jgi:hypothetical protein